MCYVRLETNGGLFKKSHYYESSKQLGRPQNIDIIDGQMAEPQTVNIAEQLDQPSRNDDDYSAVIQFYEVPFIVPATHIDLLNHIQQCNHTKVQSVTVPLHNTDDLTIQHDIDTEDANHANINGNGAVQGNIGTEYTGHANINKNGALNIQATGIEDKTTTTFEDRSDSYEKSNIQGIIENTETTDKSYYYESQGENTKNNEESHSYENSTENTETTKKSHCYEGSKINTNTCIDFLAQDVGLKCESDVNTSSNICIKSEPFDGSTTDGAVQATSGIKSESYEEMDTNHVFNEQYNDIKSESDDHMNIKQEEITVPVIPKSAATVIVLSKYPVIQDQTASFEDRSYKCAVCGKQFPTFGHLKEHKSIHSVDKPYRWARCDMCGKQFRHSQTIKEHKSIHSGEKPKCAMCRKQFRQSHSPDILDKATSINDHQDKPTSINDYQHKPTHINDCPFKCYLCGVVFKYNRTLKHHNQIHSQSGEKPYKCDVCDNMFQYVCELQEHERIHYICDVCGKQFQKSHSFKNHILIHSGEKPYKCDVCGKQFRLSQHLKLHEMIHSTERPHKCDVCDMQFRLPQYSKEHKVMHSRGIKPCMCDVCGQKFRLPRFLKAHKKVHVGERPYKCDVCGKQFRLAQHLQLHGSVHSTKQPYKCDSDEKPYICDMCGKQFRKAQHLQLHETVHLTE